LKLTGRPAELDAFENSCGDLLGAKNIELLRTYLDEAALARLYRGVDVLLSLHRAEGFGLPMLEAMSHGIPAVATAWSGNMDFMSPLDSELVPYRLVPVQDGAGVYVGSVWAEPDIEAAATALCRLADDQDHYRRLAMAAHQRVAGTRPQFPFSIPEVAPTS
jgi:glycosyltransferase involved in cell wall biosynthesis